MVLNNNKYALMFYKTPPFTICLVSLSSFVQVDRRRSQRVAGQRKRYVDDLNISFSDEEMQEGIMNPESRPKKEYKGQLVT